MDTGGGVAPDAVVVHNVGDQSAHLSDVFEVISQTDPTFGAGAASLAHGTMAQAPAPYAYIIEQPAPKSLRFRYECEGRSAGSIPGVNSVPENKTFPTIKICGYKGCMVIVVSCVTKEEPYKPHPHNLVGRDCQMGVCTVKVKTEGEADACQVQFRNLGIQCVKRRDIADALRTRQELRVNPFKTGYAHRSQPQSIDLNAVRLCFQVFLTDDAYKVQRALQPVVSEVIYDKKAMSDLLIVRSSHCSGPAKGGTTVILLCEKVTREDTEVWFFEEAGGAVVWSERGHVEYVHKQLAVVLKTPPYRDPRAAHHVTVQFQLQRLSDNAKSNTYNFEYIPEAQDKEVILGKRRKKLSYNLQEYDDRSMELGIKAEPHERTPPAPAYHDQAQWRPELAGSSHMQHAYAPQLSWQSPPYGQSPSPHHVQQPSPHHVQQPSPHHVQQPSPLHVQQPSPLHVQQPSPLHVQQPSPLHVQQPSPHHVQQPSPHLHPQVVSPGLHAAPTYAAHMLASQQMQHQQQQNLQMQSMQVPAASPHSVCSPAVSPALLHNMAGMQALGMGLQGTMDPVMGDMGQQPTYTQMDSTANSTPSLTTLLMQGEDEVQYTSGDLAHLSSLLGGRDLSDSLTRLSTRDLLQP